MKMNKEIYKAGDYEITINTNSKFLYATIRKYNPSILKPNDHVTNFIIRNAEQSDVLSDVLNNNGNKLRAMLAIVIPEYTSTTADEVLALNITHIDWNLRMYSNRIKREKMKK